MNLTGCKTERVRRFDGTIMLYAFVEASNVEGLLSKDDKDFGMDYATWVPVTPIGPRRK